MALEGALKVVSGMPFVALKHVILQGVRTTIVSLDGMPLEGALKTGFVTI